MLGRLRQAFGWWPVLAFVVAIVASGFTSGPLLIVTTTPWFVAIGSLGVLPVAIGVAILRYRLYEIVRLISRTISWAVVTALIVGLFAGFILAFQAILAPLTRSNELSVAGSILVAFGLFQPILRRVQRLVDRRFNRTRCDAERMVAAFAGRLRDEDDLEQLRAEILSTASAAVEPRSVSLWLRE